MTNKLDPNLMRGIIILKEKEQDKKFKETEEYIKTLKKVKS